jgi:putative ABC transport system permease protein
MRVNGKLLPLIAKNLCRKPARTTLTGLATAVLVIVVTLIGAVFFSLERLTAEQTGERKMVVKARWRIPSRLPRSYLALLSEGAASRPGDVRPQDWLAWQFYHATVDPSKLTPESYVLLIAIDPRKMRSMMDDLEDLDPALVAAMLANKRAVLLPREMLQALHKRVGERFQATGLGHDKGLDLKCEIVGELPEGSYTAGIMNEAYLNDAIDNYPKEHGLRHALDSRRLSMVVLKVPDAEAFRRIALQIRSCSLLSDPPLECQTPASAVATHLSPHRDLLWGMKWLLLPAVLAVLSLVVANAAGISVRERLTEMAVLKVLGFRPGQLLVLVLGEALLIGGAGGLLGAGLAYGAARTFFSGAEFLFIEELIVPLQALGWGPAVGAATAFLGGLGPAWSARGVRVAEVFAHVV